MQSDAQDLKRKWLLYAISGLVVFGFGLSLLGEATISKFTDPQSWDWVLKGTIALVVTNSGLCLFGNAMVIRSQMKIPKAKQAQSV